MTNPLIQSSMIKPQTFGSDLTSGYIKVKGQTRYVVSSYLVCHHHILFAVDVMMGETTYYRYDLLCHFRSYRRTAKNLFIRKFIVDFNLILMIKKSFFILK